MSSTTRPPMKAPKIMCDNVRQLAVSVFSMEPMTFTASVDIGSAAFLNCYWLFLGSMAGARHRGRARLIMDQRKCPDPRRLDWPRKATAFRNGDRQRRNVSAVISRTPIVIMRISVAPKSLIVCKGNSQVPPTSQDVSKYARIGKIMEVESFEAQKVPASDLSTASC